jgi:hypothetical protein
LNSEVINLYSVLKWYYVDRVLIQFDNNSFSYLFLHCLNLTMKSSDYVNLNLLVMVNIYYR